MSPTQIISAYIRGNFGVLINGYGHGTSVDNSGTIQGRSGYGVRLEGDGIVTNSGTISGYSGIEFGAYLGVDTVINIGTIAGSRGTAVAFGPGNDLLKFTPSASANIQGTVNGGGGTNTLEFVANGTTANTLTGVGANFVNFSNGTIDSGAYWVFAGTNTIGTGTTLTNSGTLLNTGTLTNAGSIGGNNVFSSGRVINVASGTISGYFAVVLQTGGSLANAGNIVGSLVGVSLANTATITNTGSIISTAGSYTFGRGVLSYAANSTIINGTAGSTAAFISASGAGIYFKGANSTAINFGTVSGTGEQGFGVYLGGGGGTIINGASGSTGALIQGKFFGAYAVIGTILNYGTIRATDTTHASTSDAALHGARTVINGDSGSTAALIAGFNGV